MRQSGLSPDKEVQYVSGNLFTVVMGVMVVLH